MLTSVKSLDSARFKTRFTGTLYAPLCMYRKPLSRDGSTKPRQLERIFMETKKSGITERHSSSSDFKVGETTPGLATNSRSRPLALDPEYAKNSMLSTRTSLYPITTVVQKICIGMGTGFIAVGLVGFGIPGFFGTHLSPTHNWVHILSGVAALYFGMKKSPPVANRFSVIFGAVYGFLGLAGFIFGSPGLISMPMMEETDRFLLPLARGQFELGTNDHILHLIIGAIFLIPAIQAYRRGNRYTL